MDADRRRLIDLLAPVRAMIADAPWDQALAQRLNAAFPPEGALFRAMEECCADGIEQGWMGLEGEEVRKGARVVEPGPETDGMSVDVVQLIDFSGPHHSHPNGEVCAVMPQDPATGRFDGNPHGWAVYPPGSAHWPKGEGGRVRILFFLPEGAIAYTEETASLGSGAEGGRTA